MKKTAGLLSLILIICIILPLTVVGYVGYIEQNSEIDMPKATPIIDGKIETSGLWSEPAAFSDATAGYFWAENLLTSEGSIYFAYDDTYLYFAGEITDNDKNNSFVMSTGYDDVNPDEDSYPYGFNGDVAVLMLDPLSVFEKEGEGYTAWYCVGLFENDIVKVYRSRVNEADITSLTKAAGKRTETGWNFEVAIPLEEIANDLNTMKPGAGYSAASISELGKISKASFMYMDRYQTTSGTDTWGRFITVCEKTYDGIFGNLTSGVNPKTYGLKLVNGAVPEHIWGDWYVTTQGNCTTDTEMERKCIYCDKIATKTIKAPGHKFGKWTVITQPTSDEPGEKEHICSVCKLSEKYPIAPYGNNKSIIVAYFNASQPYEPEFTHIDVLNFHPAYISRTPGNKNAIIHNFSTKLQFVREAAEAQNPDIKILFTVATMNLNIFESWFQNESTADELANTILSIIKEEGFDGFDIDYEFPQSGMERNQIFVYFMAQMRFGLDQMSKETGKEYLLSMAVPATEWAFNLFDIESLSNYVDYFNIMNYDLFVNSQYTHHHTSPYDNSMNELVGGSVESDINLYLSKHIPEEKIVPGCGMYAHTWNDVSGGTAGLYGKGTMDNSNKHYTDLLSNYVDKNGYVRYWDDLAKAPYLYNEEQRVFISYDDTESVKYKCDLVNQYDVRGIMIFDYCTCDGIGFFDDVYEMLSLGSNHKHEYKVISHKDPTCIEMGETTYECSVCLDKYRVPAAMLEHTPGEWQVIVEPTTLDEGLKVIKCEKCKTELDRAIIPVKFADIPDKSWYTEAALWCRDRGYITGTSNNTFSPQTELSRAMFVQILAKIAGVNLKSIKYSGGFTDVKSENWFAKAVEWASYAGITKGTGANTFSPNASVTREQFATFLLSYAKYQCFDISKSADLSIYKDSSQISNWAVNAMKWAVAEELISGTGNSNISPKAVATRAQAAVIFKKLVENIIDKQSEIE